MIYAIENGQKVPLGSQFDNSWSVKYDRDLSSQLSGKSEWTATEDCWFQYHSIWVRQNSSYTSDNAYLTGIEISLNDVNVAKMDKSSFTGETGATYMITSQLLMKKGDTVKFYSTASNDSQPAFNTTTTHVFPIHRILSKDEGPVDVTLTVDCAQSTQRNKPYTVTLYPIGNDAYIFATPLMTLYPTATTMNIVYSLANYDILDYKADYWQVAEGLPNRIGALGSDGTTYQSVVEIRSASNSTHALQIRGQGIVRRKQS